MAPTTRRTDRELLADVGDALLCTPDVDTARVGVSVRGGAVTLFGEVGSMIDRLATKRAAMRVSGVKAIADQMVVRDPGTLGTNDTDIAQAARQSLESATDLPAGSVKAGVHDRVITLSGNVRWEHQRDTAARAVRHIRGVVGLINDISVTRA
jgi:osmotically-inducible protein OsmY